MSNEQPPCDWFISSDLLFVQVHGFSKEPFCLPTYVTKRTLSLEISQQLVRVERAIGSGKNDTSITEENKSISPITLVQRNIAENVLTLKLVQLRLLVIDDFWSYDPDGCLSHRKNAVKHESWSTMEGCANPQEDDPSLYVGLNDFPILNCPPWLSFYSVLQRYNPAKPIPQAMSETMVANAWPQRKREDLWIYRQEVSQPRANIGNAPLDEHFDLEWRQYNESDETGDSLPHGYSSVKVAQQ